MSTPRHLLLGALVAASPDLILFTFGWRRRWLPPTHPMARAHRALHHPAMLLVLAYASHLVADHYSSHRKGPR